MRLRYGAREADRLDTLQRMLDTIKTARTGAAANQ